MSDIQVPHYSTQLLHCDYKTVLEKEERFPGAAALVAKLKPYYDHVVTMATSHSGQSTKAAAVRQQEYGQVTEGLEKEVRAQLNHLQSSAFMFEANDKPDQAKEVREVAATISEMFKTIERMSQPDVAAAAHRRG